MSFAADSADWQLEFKPISGVYGIYGGGIGDPIAPSRRDANIAFEITGEMAKSMFETMGPDVKDPCTERDGTRVRSKDHDKLRCQLTKDGEYTCSFGFNLKTGKSIGGSVC